jgi:O-antigen ligase
VRGPSPLSAIVFAALGAVLLVSALVLAILGSFGFIAVASVGMFFIAAALIAQAAPSPESRAPALLALAAIALIVFGLTASPFFYLGWGLLAGAATLAIVNAVRARRRAASSPD